MCIRDRDNTFDIQTPEEAKAIVEGKGGFLRSKWCGSLECELAMKERAGVSSRCMPLVQSGTEGTCPVCGRKCTTDIYWGVACLLYTSKGKNIISGYADGKFHPDRTVTVGQAVTILLRMLGYKDEDVGGVWPDSYMAEMMFLPLAAMLIYGAAQ